MILNQITFKPLITNNEDPHPVTSLLSGTFKELITLFCDKRHEVVIKELCLGAITLLLRDSCVVNLCHDNPSVGSCTAQTWK